MKPENLKIKHLMDRPPDQHDLQWLQKPLQAALELELSTLPPYLCGLYALQDPNSDAAQRVSGIVLNEMSSGFLWRYRSFCRFHCRPASLTDCRTAVQGASPCALALQSSQRLGQLAKADRLRIRIDGISLGP